MKFQPINRSQVVAALQEAGPMTVAELADYLGWPNRKVSTTIASTRWLKPEQAISQSNREARQRAPGKLDYEVYNPAKHNPDHTGYRQGIRPITMTG